MSLSERLRVMDGHKSPPAVQEEAADLIDAIDALTMLRSDATSRDIQALIRRW